MQPSQLPRFEAVQRRAFLKRMSMLGAVGLVPGLACGHDDATAFAKATTTGPTTTTNSPSISTTAPAAATSVSPPTNGPAPSTTAITGKLPAGAELQVGWVYATSDSSHNPYIAVWIESATGDLVRTISLWYKRDKERYLDELTSWYGAEQQYYDAHNSTDYESVSGASREAGSYSVAWDGTDDSGGRASTGDYVVYIESAREHGTHSLTSSTISLGTASTTVNLPDQGDLSNASARYSA